MYKINFLSFVTIIVSTMCSYLFTLYFITLPYTKHIHCTALHYCTTDSMLQNSLPEKVLEKFNQALSRDALTAAHMEGLVTCCHCSVQMLLEEDAGAYCNCVGLYLALYIYCTL